jgi:hypothetical protein
MNRLGMDKYHNYIAANPVNARLANSADEYPFCFRYLASRKAEKQGLKPA